MDNLEDWINHRRPIRPTGDLIYDKLIANRKLMRISPKFYSVNLIYKARRQKTDQTNERGPTHGRFLDREQKNIGQQFYACLYS